MGCLPSSLFVQGARPLERGESRSTWTYSPNIAQWSCEAQDSGCLAGRPAQTYKIKDHWTVARDWELGLGHPWWIFPSYSMSLRAEFPHSLGLAFNQGLPSRGSWYHSVGLGYDLGLWADNTWWLAYGCEDQILPWWSLGMSLRQMRVATQQGDLEFNEDSEYFLKHQQRNMSQIGLYSAWKWSQSGIWPSGLHLQTLWQSQILPEFGQSSLNGQIPSELKRSFWSLQLGVTWQSH